MFCFLGRRAEKGILSGEMPLSLLAFPSGHAVRSPASAGKDRKRTLSRKARPPRAPRAGDIKGLMAKSGNRALQISAEVSNFARNCRAARAVCAASAARASGSNAFFAGSATLFSGSAALSTGGTALFTRGTAFFYRKTDKAWRHSSNRTLTLWSISAPPCGGR